MFHVRLVSWSAVAPCFVVALLLDGVAWGKVASDRAKSPAISPTDGPIRLFDGESLDGCYTWLKDAHRDDPRDVFRVANGLLHITGDGFGSIITEAAYHNYHLVLEFKWGGRTWHERKDAARDSGLLIHSNGVDGGYSGIWMPSLEVQIIEGGVGDFILVTEPDESEQQVPISITCNVARDCDGEVIWQASGQRETFDASKRQRVNWFGRDPGWADVKGFRGSEDVESPHGEWTRIDVTADGGHIEVFVNGTKVNEAFDVAPREGKIQLQSELAEIFFRRWELWPIGQGPAPAPAR